MLTGNNWRTYLTMLLNQVRMDVRARYLGTFLGLSWAALGPLLWTGIYAFVIVFVLKARLSENSTPLDYVVFILCGFTPWLAFQESIMNAANSIVSNSNVVKNLPFPIEIFPVSGALTSLIGWGVGMVLIIIGLLASGRPLGAPILFLPIAMLIQILFALGFGFLFASLSVFVRDVPFLLTYFFMITLYLSPVVYDISMMPNDLLKRISWFNPVYHFVAMYRDIFYNGRWPDAIGVAYLVVFSLAVFGFGFRFFRRTKNHFSDFLA
jgi:lipopolysaccharide transport system permease protein